MVIFSLYPDFLVVRSFCQALWRKRDRTRRIWPSERHLHLARRSRHRRRLREQSRSGFLKISEKKKKKKIAVKITSHKFFWFAFPWNGGLKETPLNVRGWTRAKVFNVFEHVHARERKNLFKRLDKVFLRQQHHMDHVLFWRQKERIVTNCNCQTSLVL